MTTSLRLQCECGRVRGRVGDPRSGTRAVCYCIDCQAFAHFLGTPGQVLDALGGTDILAIHPRQVTFDSGEDLLASVSLTGRTLRWYAACCRTAIGNTPRDRRIAHVGLVHQCLGSETALTDAAGPVRLRVHPEGAHGSAPKTPPLRFAAALARYLSKAAWARVSGSYRTNPFFDPGTGTPRVQPERLARDAYERLKATARGTGPAGWRATARRC